MNHPTQEQLILHYYGEDGVSLGDHFAVCEGCRDEYRKLQLILNTVESLPVPDRSADYGTEVWNRLRSRLGGSMAKPWWHWQVWRWLEWRRGVAVGAMAALILIAFLVGRYGHRAPQVTNVASSGPVRERILLVAVGDHLERSKVVLAELSNLGTGNKGMVDISYEQRAAEDLVESSRLFRLSASSTGDDATASLLDELERVLMDVANGPSNVDGAQLEQIQKRISDAGILFKVRVFASSVERRETDSRVVN